MKKVKLLVIFAFLFMYGSANAQPRPPRPGRVPPSPSRNIERAVERKAEQRAEEERARGEAEAEKGLNKAAEKIEEARKAQEEADAKADNILGEIPEVGNTPYTPSESEFAFFAMKKGNVQVFTSKDAKGKITGQARNTIKEITGTKNAFAIIYQSEILDAKGKPADKDNPLVLNYRVVVKDGIMYADMKGMFGAMEGLDGIQVSGTTMKIPNNLSVGQTLEDAAARVKAGFINSTAIMTEGKCLAIEDVTVAAGTFRCHKISQKVTTTTMGVKNESTTLTWYAKGVGAVKTESYDKKGNLQSVQELTSNK